MGPRLPAASLLRLTLSWVAALASETHRVVPAVEARPVFLAIGSFDASHAARRDLIRRTYLRGLAAGEDYAFFVQNATAEEIRARGDVVVVPRERWLDRCDGAPRGVAGHRGVEDGGKACRSGETFAYALRSYGARSDRPFVLGLDDDGFLCREALYRLAATLKRAGRDRDFVMGTWQRKGRDLVRPDQNFVLMSRDVAGNASNALDARGPSPLSFESRHNFPRVV